jgi:hypothetical protein
MIIIKLTERDYFCLVLDIFGVQKKTDFLRRHFADFALGLHLKMAGAGGRRIHRFLCGASRAYRDGCGGAAAAAVEFFHAAADLALRRRRRYVVQRQCTASY